jgi:hypothetical protein
MDSNKDAICCHVIPDSSSQDSGKVFRPMVKECRVFIYTLILSASINLITNILGGVSLWTLTIVPFLGFSAYYIYCYGKLHEGCEEEINGEINIKARESKTSQISISEKRKIQNTIYGKKKKRFRQLSTVLTIYITATIILFFIMLYFNKTKVEKLVGEIDTLKKDTVSKTSYESYRNSIGYQLVEVDNKATKLLKNQNDFLQIKNHVDSSNRILLDKNIALIQHIEQLEGKIGTDSKLVVDLLEAISIQQDEILAKLELIKKSMEVHCNSERISAEASTKDK